MSSGQFNLRLVGYYRCAGHGFAMPLYGQSEGANTLYIARCSISGDHHGTIEAFEPVDVDNHRRLPHGESIAVEVGELWRDVFLWNDAAYVGTPEQLWAELTPFHPDVEARAPLSLLDLAIHAGRGEVAALAPTALAFLQQRYDNTRARSWRRQLLRQQAEVALRRALADQHLDDALFQGLSLMEIRPDVLALQLPDALAAATSLSNEAVDVGIGWVTQLAALLGAQLTDVFDKATALPDVTPRTMEGVAPTTARGPSSGNDGPVLIIAEGKRARDVVSHLRSARDREMRSIGENWEIIAGSQSMLSIPKEIHAKSVIVLVLGEDEKGPAHLTPGLEQFLERHAQAGALILLAPALPASRPSTLFDDRSNGRGPVRAIHAILDTAVARSPFWWGKAKRSFDRRISDILKLAIAAAQSPVIRRELLERRPEDSVPILSVGVVPSSGDKESLFDERGNLRLGSEASWVSSDPKRGDPAVLFSVRINPDEFDSHHYDTQLVVEGRKRENRFPEFAGRVLAPILGRRSRRSLLTERRIEQLPYLPDEITQVLRAPEYVGAFGIDYDSDYRLKLAVTGETPSVHAVEQADRLGWRIARYTDTSTLRRFSEDVHQPASFPDEIDIGPIRSHEINRRLATRGVDQRDVIRISYDLLSEWLDNLPAEDRRTANKNARPLRSATRPYGESETDHLLLRDYVLGSDPAARILLSMVSSHSKSPNIRPMKRFSDLIKCWTPPSSGFQRYAMVDGSVPIVLLELGDGEIPVEDLFVIDGDFAVPALFRSRVFAVWARATLPAASSWMARFSVANTFGGFPLAEPFRIVGQEGSLAALVFDGGPSLMGDLAQEVGQYIQRALGSQSAANWKEAHRVSDELPAMRRLNEIVLDAYGLPGNTDDIHILQRLQEMNAAFD